MKTGIIAGIVLALLSMGAPAHAEPEPSVVAVGDSITLGADVPRAQRWPVRIGASTVAVGGGCLVTVGCVGHPALRDYGRTVLTRQPEVVIVAYGMNDLIHSSAQEIVAGLKEVRRRNAARGVVTFVATLTPVRERAMGLNPARKELNQLIRKRFACWRIIDFSAALAAPGGRLDARYDGGDGLHPSARGYAAMAREARRTISESNWATRPNA